MIKDINGKPIKKMPHNAEYQALKNKLTATQFAAISQKIDNLLVASNGKFVPSWQNIDWQGQVFQPLVAACGGDKELSSMFYGLICWDVIQQDPIAWKFAKFEKDGKEFSIYFV